MKPFKLLIISEHIDQQCLFLGTKFAKFIWANLQSFFSDCKWQILCTFCDLDKLHSVSGSALPKLKDCDSSNFLQRFWREDFFFILLEISA